MFRKIYLFYYQGFRSMTVGKRLWLIIFIKLFIMFAVLKLFFFRDYLNKFETDKDKSEYVLENLIKNKK